MGGKVGIVLVLIMGALECVGCAMLAFSPPLAMFIFVIAPDPLRIILFVLGAFFWLMSLLVSSIVWFAVLPLRDVLAFALFFSVIFQELFRFFYFIVLKKAQKGLEKVSSNGIHVAGVHSLKNARHTEAFVCGVGFGVMSGAFSLVNILADSWQAGTVGLPGSTVVNGTVLLPSSSHANYTFLLVSSLGALAVMLLHVFWTIIMWNACDQWSTKPRTRLLIPFVLITHLAVVALSFLSQQNLAYVSLPLIYAICIVMGGVAARQCGVGVSSLKAFINMGNTDSMVRHRVD